MCGAGNIISIYSNGTMTPYQAASIQKTGLPGSWKYQGCLSDADNPRSLPYQIVWTTNNSNTNCLTQCAEFGYGAASQRDLVPAIYPEWRSTTIVQAH
jgi:hypothetical protein